MTPGDADTKGNTGGRFCRRGDCFDDMGVFFFHAWQVPKAVVKDLLEYHFLLSLGSVGQILHVRVVPVFIPNMAGLGVIKGVTGL